MKILPVFKTAAFWREILERLNSAQKLGLPRIKIEALSNGLSQVFHGLEKTYGKIES